ncbi:MAG TPA: tRNA (adenosine(37)-N6)-dimethylallyltransferase MiaA [Smithellaceae bacterium]|nr:tRNA (adenosine(37)-N6)-dimethylallyltransferase MiaA [Smithellaceae bacterium]
MKSNDCSNENKAPKIPLIVICSPTATGKTQLALDLAETAGGEILNADSLQVYRYMDIGTAKPGIDERNRVPHHLIDVVNPDEDYNAALYAQQARSIIDDLNRKKKPVFVVGGTGLYIRALLSGIIETPPVDETLRNYYRGLRDRHGREYLYGLLQHRDPQAALRINPNDSVRVIRALEVLDQSGESIVTLQLKHAFSDCPYEALKIGLSVERNVLKDRIAARTAKMLEAGLVDEVQSLLARGYGENLKPLQSLGYKQVIDFLRGRCNREEAVHQINRDTWHYSKRQMTWFSADKTIGWFAPDQQASIQKRLEEFLSK